MSQVSKQIMQVLFRSPGCALEDVVMECPGLTWNQVFCEIDRMSRSGQVRLDRKGPGLYTITIAQRLAVTENLWVEQTDARISTG
jgi:hypothetical protein